MRVPGVVRRAGGRALSRGAADSRKSDPGAEHGAGDAPVLRKLGSALLLTAVGFPAGAFVGGLATFYVYAIGFLPGAVFGAVAGGLLGWRTPLRDSVLLFVVVYGGGALGAALAGPVRGGRPDNGMLFGLLEPALAGLGAILGVLLVFVPVRFLAPGEWRRNTAVVAAVGFALWLLWRLVHYAFIGQPL